MKSEKQFINSLKDVSDRAQVDISNNVKDALRTLCISD
jgi:hypothetical protein